MARSRPKVDLDLQPPSKRCRLSGSGISLAEPKYRSLSLASNQEPYREVVAQAIQANIDPDALSAIVQGEIQRRERLLTLSQRPAYRLFQRLNQLDAWMIERHPREDEARIYLGVDLSDDDLEKTGYRYITQGSKVVRANQGEDLFRDLVEIDELINGPRFDLDRNIYRRRSHDRP